MTETTSDIKLFTVEKANRALPLVRRIVDDIAADHPVWKDLVARYELAAAGARPEWGESAEMVMLRRGIDAVAEQIGKYVKELEAIGCQLKGFEQGLVDFYHRHDGRLVYLCWQRDEPTVAHWHELDAGFAGRREIGPEFSGADRDGADR